MLHMPWTCESRNDKAHAHGRGHQDVAKRTHLHGSYHQRLEGANGLRPKRPSRRATDEGAAESDSWSKMPVPFMNQPTSKNTYYTVIYCDEQGSSVGLSMGT